MNNRHLIYIATLIRKSISGEITLEEKRQLEDWLDESARHRELFDKYNNPDFLASVDIEKDMAEAQEAYSNFMQRLKPAKPVRRIVWNRYVAAAALIAFVCASAIFVYMYDGGNPHSPAGLAVVPVQHGYCSGGFDRHTPYNCQWRENSGAEFSKDVVRVIRDYKNRRTAN